MTTTKTKPVDEIRNATAAMTDVAADVENVWHVCPDVVAAEARRDAVAPAVAKLVALGNRLSPVAGVVAVTFNRLLDGEDVTPEEFTAALVNSGATSVAGEAIRTTALNASDSARADLESTKQANAGMALTRLNELLERLVPHARQALEAFDRYDGTDQDAELGAATVAKNRAIAVHTRIRGLQRELTNYDAGGNAVGDMLDLRGLVRDAAGDDVPDWRDGEAVLRFVCRPEMHAWVPTYAQLRDAGPLRLPEPQAKPDHDSQPQFSQSGEWPVDRRLDAALAAASSVHGRYDHL